jgi:dienelactone hydrolase
MKIFFLLLLSIWMVGSSAAQHDSAITFQHDGITVYGTFSVPEGTGRFPTVIINPGSGAIDRDGTVPLTDGNSACIYPEIYGDTVRMYKELANMLVDSGYAVLRYDKLEYTNPNGLGIITFHKLWLPVESAIKFVKQRSEVDTSQIILLGHSEGSSLIPFIADGRNDIKALIAVAGARTPFDTLLAWQYAQLYQLLKPCGATPSDSIYLSNLGKQVLNYFHIIRTSWNGNTPPFAGVPAQAWYDYIQATDHVADHYNAANRPTLFIGLGEDLNVPPSELQRLKQDVTITNDFWSIPGKIHYMGTAQDVHVSKIVTDTILYWLRQIMLPTGIAGIPDQEYDFIQVAPNPFSSNVNIELDLTRADVTAFSVSDATGNACLTQTIPKGADHFKVNLDLHYLPAGIYYLSMTNKGKQVVRKLVKE